jgi:CcmD family protein
MKTLKRWCAVLSVVLACGAVSLAAQQPSPQPTQQNDWIPVNQLPPQEQMAAAPLLIGAYMFVLVVLFVYVFRVARRLQTVQQEIDRLDTTMKQGGRA